MDQSQRDQIPPLQRRGGRGAEESAMGGNVAAPGVTWTSASTCGGIAA